MLPAHIAENVRQQILFYLQSTFAFRDPRVERQFELFLNDPEDGIFKGPWVTLRRPYRPAQDGVEIPFELNVPFHPFLHQYRAWRRLTSKDQQPQSTIVTTGTGSGKTECFLYPLLDHCLRAKGEGRKGIKAIVLYPMNALAADQEKRFARTIWKDAALKAAGIRVGNYTGRYDPAEPGAGRNSGEKQMGENHGISNHAVQQEEPPDILLTNYKMLDFLLMRPQDQNLWRFNDPGVLRYLVLDELHTYDGAQGSDVACLIRRLKERLGIVKGELCVVGTSATLDDRGALRDSEGGTADTAETGSDRLAVFAGKLFEESIEPGAVIGEDRLEVHEIARTVDDDMPLPSPADCEPLDHESAEDYAVRQAGVWGGPVFASPAGATDEERSRAFSNWTVALGDWLKTAPLFRSLLEVFREAERQHEAPLTWQDLLDRLARRDLAFANVAGAASKQSLITSFLAVVAHAHELRSDRPYPLVPTQVQLWVRELRRLGRVVSDAPAFAWLDEPPPNRTCLPTFHCSECGESGWVALHDTSSDALIQSRGVDGFQLGDDPTAIYRAWFGYKGARSQHIVVVSPWDDTTLDADRQQELAFEHQYLCSQSLVIRRGDGPCPITRDARRFRVRVNRDVVKNQKTNVVAGDQGCPRCGSKVGVFFVGSQSATLSSVAVDEMFGSNLNGDPKLLAFTDSTQDASHRAGFFTARTYHFTFRTALQHVIDAAGPAGIPLCEVGRRMLEYWATLGPGRPGSMKEAMASLIPADLHEYGEWLEFRNNEAQTVPPSKLLRDIAERLTWEAVSEFGFMQTHGRTMELAGSACVAWDEGLVEATLARFGDKLPKIDVSLAGLDAERWRLWLLGILHRYRERGALNHPYMLSYARQNYWGKYPFGRLVKGRETYPPSGRYRPSLLVTQLQREHEFILASTRGSTSPWHVKWARRALNLPGKAESDILDVIRGLFEAGVDAGLFEQVHRDGDKRVYAIAAAAPVLCADPAMLRCSETGRPIVRPTREAELWRGAVSMEYYADHGVYAPADYSPRQRYYQARYRKGALRRVVAQEHTGLLGTELREKLEHEFAGGLHRDDPNILTCTSTLEMGIDIGDLSSTMLCSVPPSTASYLQRIGRAGRATGTALIISIINQRPHDLFFYGRPMEMLKGKVDPPGCWLDAAAVLARQYLAYCFDSATKNGVLDTLPRNGRQLVEDLERDNGQVNGMLAWVGQREDELRSAFLGRFRLDILQDTRDRFIHDTDVDLLRQRIHQAAQEFSLASRDLENAKRRLQDQRKAIRDEQSEDGDLDEIDREIRIVAGRLRSHNRTSALEILTDHGLLPNYAFPERGVGFYGAVYNRHDDDKQRIKPVEVVRAARQAVKELAPWNTFYTHSRQFDVQQIAIGNSKQSLQEKWAICASCGHMRLVTELEKPHASPACPQCGDETSQTDIGQQHDFIEFAKSQALSYMEHYESLSSDRSDEREREYYQIVSSFDQTVEAPSGAVGEDDLPFGIEYRASMIMREVNVGYLESPGVVGFGPDIEAPQDGFLICPSCGVAVEPGKRQADVKHRRSCSVRRQQDRDRQQDRTTPIGQWPGVYLYRELKSEAIRLLLPLADEEDLDTITAALFLGLRLRFEGSPAHLIVAPQILPNQEGLNKHFLVLLDGVPGGTGYLKTLYQEKDTAGREGEGVVEVMRLALQTLETCGCRRVREENDKEDTDGCYRCIRTYHLQYVADNISRERAIVLLRQFIDAAEKRVPRKALEQIETHALYGSLLEKRFVDALRRFVLETRHGEWESTIINGKKGFRFTLERSARIWELELQPNVGPAQGVMVQSNPDFMLRCDDERVKPVAIFTDGFAYHCHPNNRLADDMNKRRAILDSGNFHVWNVTWDDVVKGQDTQNMVCAGQVAQFVSRYAGSLRRAAPDATRMMQDGMTQLLAFLDCPDAEGWGALASFAVFLPLQTLMNERSVSLSTLDQGLDTWRDTGGMPALACVDDGDWVYNDRASLTSDVVAIVGVNDVLTRRMADVIVLARLGDSESEVTGSDFTERWRRFLACLNLYQFCGNLCFWAAGETAAGTAPDIPFEVGVAVSGEWQQVREEVVPSMQPCVDRLVGTGVPVPEAGWENPEIEEEAYAELAWLDARVAVLAGDQADLAGEWQARGWTVAVADDLQARGIAWLVNLVTERS